jgi:hypothetical protein
MLLKRLVELDSGNALVNVLPIFLSVHKQELYKEYAEDKKSGGSGKAATNKLLDSIEEGMKG